MLDKRGTQHNQLSVYRWLDPLDELIDIKPDRFRQQLFGDWITGDLVVIAEKILFYLLFLGCGGQDGGPQGCMSDAMVPSLFDAA